MKKIFKIFFACLLLTPFITFAQTYGGGITFNSTVNHTGVQVTIAPGGVTIQSGGHLICGSLNMSNQPANALIVESGGTLTVEGVVLNNTQNSAITIQHGGSFVTTAATVFTESTVQIEKSASATGYSYITSPVVSSTYDGSEYTYNESNHSGGYGTFEETTFGVAKTPGIGYADSGAGAIQFIGAPNVAAIDLDLSITGSAARTSSSSHHLIGNPYAAAIDMDDFYTFNTSNNTTNTFGTYYVWNPANNGGDGGYDALTTGFITSGQSFFIQLDYTTLADDTDHTIQFDPSMITDGNNATFYREEANNYGELVINFSTNNDANNKLTFRVGEDFTTAFDKRYDAYSISFEEKGQLRVKAAYNEKFHDILAIPLGNEVIPLNLKLAEALTVNAEVVEMKNIPSGYSFQLVDLTTGTSYPLSASSKLSFDLPETASLNTFEIRMTAAILGTKPEANSFIYSKNQHLIYKNNKNDSPSKLSLYTLDGRVLGNWNIPSEVSEYSMPLSGSLNGLYLVRVQTIDGFYTQKVIIK
jgi:hypothetical protein